MPRKIQSATVNFASESERESILRRAAAAGMSVANWFRAQAKLPPLRHGGRRTATLPESREGDYGGTIE